MSIALDIRPSETLVGKRILIVEDEIFVALDLQSELEAAGAILIGPATSLDAALVAANDPTLDAAIVDVDLKGERSFPVAEVLTRNGTPFIWHTGVIDRDVFVASFPDITVIEKPTHDGAIIDAVLKLFAADPSDPLRRL